MPTLEKSIRQLLEELQAIREDFQEMKEKIENLEFICQETNNYVDSIEDNLRSEIRDNYEILENMENDINGIEANIDNLITHFGVK